MGLVQNIKELIIFVDLTKRGKPSQIQWTWLFSYKVLNLFFGVHFPCEWSLFGNNIFAVPTRQVSNTPPAAGQQSQDSDMSGGIKDWTSEQSRMEGGGVTFGWAGHWAESWQSTILSNYNTRNKKPATSHKKYAICTKITVMCCDL